MSKKVWLLTAVAALGFLALGIYTSYTAYADGDSQLFTPARFALVQGDVNVGVLQNGGNPGQNLQKAMFKVDTATGQVWVLQLSVMAANDPTVQSAVWAPVAPSGQFRPNGGPASMGGMTDFNNNDN